MQLPPSTVPSDSTSFARLCPDKSAPSTSRGAVSKRPSAGEDSEFDQLIAEFAPSKAPASSGQTPDMAALAALCAVPFAETGATAPAICGGERDGGEDLPTDETRLTDEGERALEVGEIGARAARAETAYPGTKADVPIPSQVHAQRNRGTAAGFRSEDDNPKFEPNDRASGPALRAVGFNGLPDAARENRIPEALPPGVARLMSARELVTQQVASISPEDNAEVPASAAIPTPRSNSSEPALPAHVAPNFGTREASRSVSSFDSLASSGLLSEFEAAGEEEFADAEPLVASDSIPVLPDPARATALHSTLPEPSNRFAKADFAAGRREFAGADQPRLNSLEKSVVDADQAQLTTGVKAVGIGAAKDAPMFARFLPDPVRHPAFEYAGNAVSAPDAVADLASDAESSPVVGVSAAHEAVEVVLQSVEQASAQGQKSVNLKFSVGEADLSVRVELHAREVRTTFRTDSAELRAALSQEWDALASSSSADRGVRIVPALFAASEHSAHNAFAGDTPSRHREQSAEHNASGRAVIATSRSGNSVATAAGNTMVAPVSIAASRTSHHLHTVA